MSESLERNPPSGIRISDSGSASEMYPASASWISIGMVVMVGVAGMLGRVRPVGTFRMGRSGWLGRWGRWGRLGRAGQKRQVSMVEAATITATSWPASESTHFLDADEETFVDMARSNALFQRSNLMNYARTSRSGPKC